MKFEKYFLSSYVSPEVVDKNVHNIFSLNQSLPQQINFKQKVQPLKQNSYRICGYNLVKEYFKRRQHHSLSSKKQTRFKITHRIVEKKSSNDNFNQNIYKRIKEIEIEQQKEKIKNLTIKNRFVRSQDNFFKYSQTWNQTKNNFNSKRGDNKSLIKGLKKRFKIQQEGFQLHSSNYWHSKLRSKENIFQKTYLSDANKNSIQLNSLRVRYNKLPYYNADLDLQIKGVSKLKKQKRFIQKLMNVH